MNETENINMARAIRFITIRGYLKAGYIDYEFAVEVMSGPLSPDGEPVNDSDFLHLTNQEISEILGLKPYHFD